MEEIQESSNEGNLDNLSTQLEDEIPVDTIDNSLPIQRPDRVNMPPEFYGFHIIIDGYMFINDNTLVNLDEPANYKEAMAGPKAAIWNKEINSGIQSMYDNQVWNLVDHVLGRKIIR